MAWVVIVQPEPLLKWLSSILEDSSSQESDSSPSPPSYAVFEDEYGNLVNPGLNVVWPLRPNRGRYSLREHKEQKKHLRQLAKQQRRNSKSREHANYSTTLPNLSRATMAEEIKDDRNIYIGVQSTSSLHSVLLPTEFRLFYMLPESMRSFNQVPVKMPLMLAYMRSSGKINKFNLKKHENNSGAFWQLDLRDPESAEQPVFRSLSALIRHYKTFVIDRIDGKSESIPSD